MANEKAGVIYGNGWEAGSVVDGKNNGNAKLEGKIATAGMPGPEGKALPSFIGGSDLGIVEKSKAKDLARSGSPSSPTRSPWRFWPARTSCRTTPSSWSR